MNEKHELNLKVRYVEIDGMKIVHNSKYLVYFEEARIDLVRKENYPYEQIEHDGFIFPISEIKIIFKDSIFYDEDIKVIVTVGYLKNFSVKFNYQILKQNNSIACEGYSIHAFINKQTKKFEEMPEKLINIFKKYLIE